MQAEYWDLNKKRTGIWYDADPDADLGQLFEMKETTSAAMPPCFNKWCQRFDDLFRHKSQKREFRNYLGGLLGESERKNLTQIANNGIGVTYHKTHHFMTESVWNSEPVNERRLDIMNKCRQTQIQRGFSLIVDDSGHRKSGHLTEGSGRQYLGEIGKVDNGIVTVTTHLYDEVKSLPLDVALYQHADSLPEGKQDPQFKKKPDLVLELIDRCLDRGKRPSVLLMDGGYGNNGPLMNQLVSRNLTYIVGVHKSRKVKVIRERREISQRLDEVVMSLSPSDFTPLLRESNSPKQLPKKVWVATFPGTTSKVEGQQTFAVILNTSTLTSETKVDYLMTNAPQERATATWIVTTYCQRNWIEVFYREVKNHLGFREYQVRGKNSLYRHFILVFVAYTFILWHKLTGGLRRQWANKSLDTFAEALEAFRTGVSYRFVQWLQENADVYAAHKARLGYIWR